MPDQRVTAQDAIKADPNPYGGDPNFRVKQGVYDDAYVNYLLSLTSPPPGDLGTDYATATNLKNALGRNPTASEFGTFGPLGAQAGQAISQYALQQENTPDKLAARQNKEYLANAPQHYDSVNKLFQTNFGRDASDEEKSHFGSLLASGTTDSYQLQQFLQQQPEFQDIKNKKFQGELGTQMATGDQKYFSESILPAIQSAYAKQGRSFDSSSFQAAATNSAQAQNNDRQKFLAGVSADQYNNTSNRAYQDYANQVAQQNQLTNSGINAQYGNIQNSVGRANQITDFNLQKQAYNDYLAKYGKRGNSGIGSLIGGGLGAGVGAYFGGPAGAKAGYQIGSGLGNAGESMYSGSY